MCQVLPNFLMNFFCNVFYNFQPALITNHEIDGSSIGASGSGVACGSARGSSAASGSAAASGSSTAANKAAPVATKPANERVHYKVP